MRLDYSFLYRKKGIENVQQETSKLNRALNWFDLTTLGVGLTLGGIIYIFIGALIVEHTGPSIILSFLIAGIGSLFSGLAYAELGARVPKSGSAYAYIYITIGEFFAFVIGWDVLLEYMIACATVSNSLSSYIDSMFNYAIKNALKSAMPMESKHFAEYPDFFAFGLTMAMAFVLIIGVKDSIIFNKTCTCVNVLIILFIIICGATKSDFKYWTISEENFNVNDSANNTLYCDRNTKHCGTGGFFPFGFYGTVEGIAKCYFAYIGFDSISTTGEEVVNPQKAIPLSIILTLIITTILYISSSAVITSMMPYYLIDIKVPIVEAFKYVHLDWVQYVVSTGAIISLITCLYAALYPLSRLIYSIAADGLLFKPLGNVLPRVQTPAIATFISAFLTGVLAGVFNLDQLVEMCSIGTIMAYTFVSLSVLVLRYRPSSAEHIQSKDTTIKESLFKRLLIPKSTECTFESAFIVNSTLFMAVVLIIILCLILTFVSDLSKGYLIFIIVLLTLGILLSIIIIWRQPQNTTITTFKVPFSSFNSLSKCNCKHLSIAFSIYTYMA